MEEFNAFTFGIEPGGLRSKNDIRILICYILAGANSPLLGDDITKVLQEQALANYFEITDALSSLLERGNISKDDLGNYTVTENGRHIAAELDTRLPLSVRDKATESVLRLLARAKNERENRVEIVNDNNGIKVILHISGGDFDLMTISLMVPDMGQAELVKNRFHDNPQKFYSLVLAAATDDKHLQKELFE